MHRNFPQSPARMKRKENPKPVVAKSKANSMIVNLIEGSVITPTRFIKPGKHWHYARECAGLSGGLMPGAELKVVDVSKVSGSLWVKAELPGRDPVAYLKIDGEEYA